MAHDKDSLGKIEFAQWNLDETSIKFEESSESTASENSENRMASSMEHVEEKEPEPIKGDSSVYRSIIIMMLISMATFICNAVRKIPKTTKELGDFVRSAQKAKILKILVAVLLVFLLVWLLKEMCFQHLTISFLVKKVNHLNATKVALANEADYLKATNVALTKEIDGIKETNRAQAEYRREQLAKDSERNTTIQLRDVRKFLDSHEKEKLGESFRCSGLSWHLYFEKFSSWMENQLLVYVCHDKTDFFGYRFGDWSVSATFDLTMVNHGDKEKSKTLHFSNVFEKNSQYHCYGELFGAISDLYDGFVRDDAIDFKLQFNSLQLKLID